MVWARIVVLFDGAGGEGRTGSGAPVVPESVANEARRALLVARVVV